MTDSVRNLTMGYVWIFQPENNPNTNLKNNTKIGHCTQIQASAMAIPVLWPEPCRTWVRWTEEKKHRHGAVNLKNLERFWMKEWSRISVRCSPTSSGIIGEYLELLNWQMEVSKSIEWKGTVNCGQCVLEKNIYFIMIFPLILNSYWTKWKVRFLWFFFIKDQKD